MVGKKKKIFNCPKSLESRSLDNVIPTKLGFTEWRDQRNSGERCSLVQNEKFCFALGGERRAKWRKHLSRHSPRIMYTFKNVPLSLAPADAFPLFRCSYSPPLAVLQSSSRFIRVFPSELSFRWSRFTARHSEEALKLLFKFRSWWKVAGKFV